MASIKQSDMDAFATIPLEQTNNPLLKGDVAQVECNSSRLFSQPFHHRGFGGGQSLNDVWVVDYVCKCI
ncbi:hypothetical protein IP79_14695 [Porphyrobacter sp. AAP60]|nr:hypothetical protein IP79_14695 [Porphyrobacter sp. AAP60]